MSVPGEPDNFASETSAPEASDTYVLAVIVATLIYAVKFGPPFHILCDLAILFLHHLAESFMEAILLSVVAATTIEIEIETGEVGRGGNDTGPVVSQQDVVSSVHQVESQTSTSSVEIQSPRHEYQSSNSTAPVLEVSQISAALNGAMFSFSANAFTDSSCTSSVQKMEAVVVDAAKSIEAAKACLEIALSGFKFATMRGGRARADRNKAIADNELLRAQNTEAEARIASLEQTLYDTIRKAVPQQEVVHQVESQTSTSSVEIELPGHENQSLNATAPVLDEISLSELSVALHMAINHFSVDYLKGNPISETSAKELEAVKTRAAVSTEAAVTCFKIALSRLQCVSWHSEWRRSVLTARNELLRAQKSEAEAKIARLEPILAANFVYIIPVMAQN